MEEFGEFTPLDPMGILAAAPAKAEEPAPPPVNSVGAAEEAASPGLRQLADRAAPGLNTPDRAGAPMPDAGAAPRPENTSTPPQQRPAHPLRDGIIESAKALGVNPVDLATAISYETGGTFDPTKRGPTTQWGQHRGLIQFGQPQAQKYGVDWNNPLGSQLGENGAVVKYLRDTGVKPGMGLLDIYSAINAGGVGRYNRSDANNGGAPGTVADKVNNQMAGHRAKAEALLGGGFTPPATNSGDGQRGSGGTVAATGAAPPPDAAKRPMPEDLLDKEPKPEERVASAVMGLSRRSSPSSAPGLSGGQRQQSGRSPNAMNIDSSADAEIADLDAQISSMQQTAFRDPRAAAALATLQQKRSNLQAMA